MLGIPTHLAPRVNAWSTVRAFHAAAVGSVLVAAVSLLLFRFDDPRVAVVPAVLALLPMLAMIGVHVQFSTWRSAVAFLLVGGICAWWCAVVVLREVPVPWVASYLLSLVVVPLVLVGGAGAVPGRVVLWSIAGLVVGRVATSIATAQTGGAGHPLVLAWVTLAFVVAIVLVASRTTARSQRVQPELLRSAREEHVSAYRAGVELEASAILHDTVLNHLGAISLAPDGPMDAQLARTVEADVAMLTGTEWLAPAPQPDPGAAVDAFEHMLADERAEGLEVLVTGDPAAMGRLESDAVTALVRAVGQCLANVRKHAGTDTAEVSVFDDGVACTVMVVDDGRGFDEQQTGADRMGLRNSVRERIGRVGGDVQVWSSPGTGTSVMMTVPHGARAAAVAVPDGASS
ncbi:sensor histidine kinase [Curtobacterium sp. MCBA15_001]|uniref:sensor histidine kinase n=1 Tax=Curtobacterium sp. MCBA15_001 TaxID=1898731 RepID=UPI000B31F7DC|nr:ATP-binding protein [Curtobacterium sp. MCBA15_001]